MNNLTKNDGFSLTPKNLDEAMKYAEMMAKSSIVPKNYQGKAGDILVAVQMGAELGLKPIQSLQNIAVINGKPSIYGDACIALIQSHPEFEDIEEFFEGDGDKLTAVCVLKRKGKTPQRATFSVDDAKKASLWAKQGPWSQYPKRMLQMRARGFALRNGFADALLGLILAEEAHDYKDVTPADTSKTSATDKLLSKLIPATSQVQEEIVNVQVVDSDIKDNDMVEQTDLFNRTLPTLAERLSSLIVEKEVPLSLTNKWLEASNTKQISEMKDSEIQKCIDYINEKYS